MTSRLDLFLSRLSLSWPFIISLTIQYNPHSLDGGVRQNTWKREKKWINHLLIGWNKFVSPEAAKLALQLSPRHNGKSKLIAYRIEYSYSSRVEWIHCTYSRLQNNDREPLLIVRWLAYVYVRISQGQFNSISIAPAIVSVLCGIVLRVDCSLSIHDFCGAWKRRNHLVAVAEDTFAPLCVRNA